MSAEAPEDVQDAALTALALGRSSRDVGKLLGMRDVSVRRWSSGHRAEIAERRSEILAGAFGQVLTCIDGATALLLRAVTEEGLPAAERLSLARTSGVVFELAVKLRDATTLEARMTALEAEARERKGT